MNNSTMVGTGFAMEGRLQSATNEPKQRVFPSLISFQESITAMLCMNFSARCLGDRFKLNVNDPFSSELLRSQLRIFHSGSLNMLLAGWPSIINKVETLLSQVWCQRPTGWKSLAAFVRECVQLLCEVKTTSSSADTTPFSTGTFMARC